MTEKTKREAPVSYRPPEHLREEFRARVEKSGLSVSGFITASIFGSAVPRQSRRPPLEKQELARILAECIRLRGALEALPPEARDPALLEEAVRTLQEIRNAVMLAKGRSP
ncbi:hypothetical protein [Hyphomicrobium sp.]|uniref:hypothetical protein n=1 Tax=Hyphomicrobium sp. TaxID=82 RepID=UPI003F70875D